MINWGPTKDNPLLAGLDHTLIMNFEDIDRYCSRDLPNSMSNKSQEFRNAPFNDSCLQSFFNQLHLQLRRYNEWEEVMYTCIYVVISVLAIIGNGLVMIAVLRKKTMRTNRNVLILNLAFSNLILAIINIPFLWIPSINFEFPHSQFFCKFANVLPGSNIYCSTFTISVMAIDRYYSVRKLSLQSNRNQCVRAVLISLSIWVLSFMLSLPLLVYYDIVVLYVFKDVNVLVKHPNGTDSVKIVSYGWRQCRLSPPPSKAGTGTQEERIQHIQLLVSVMQVIFIYIIPLIVLSIFNVKLTRFLKMNANQMSRNRRDHSETTKLANKEYNHHHHHHETPPKRNGFPKQTNSFRCKAENASERRTSRTTSLLVAMAGSFAALWLPYTVITFLMDLNLLFDDSMTALIERIDQVCKALSMCALCVNPFLYGFLNTNFRHEFTEIFYTYFFRCAPHARLRAQGYNPEFSSVAFGLRNSMPQTQDENIFSSLRRSFRGSMEKMKCKESNGFGSFRSARGSSTRSAFSRTSPRNDLSQSTHHLTVERERNSVDAMSPV